MSAQAQEKIIKKVARRRQSNNSAVRPSQAVLLLLLLPFLLISADTSTAGRTDLVVDRQEWNLAAENMGYLPFESDRDVAYRLPFLDPEEDRSPAPPGGLILPPVFPNPSPQWVTENPPDPVHELRPIIATAIFIQPAHVLVVHVPTDQDPVPPTIIPRRPEQVPEPGTAVLLAGAVAMAMLNRRRRRPAVA